MKECGLVTIFVFPEYQGQGIGRIIIDTLEQDEPFRRAKRIEIGASITVCQF
ncbi:GNAT family N-acetyltransferase [Diplocloster hominis]|uniref:GNAT family N-acetyltransferase n=1 Tax=Diplocloster hominis TaxID=3079010 RepID=UPI003CCF8A04